MIIPWKQLSAEALRGVLEECVTRDGTEPTDAAVKIAQVRRALERGRLVITYDMTLDDLAALLPGGDGAR